MFQYLGHYYIPGDILSEKETIQKIKAVRYHYGDRQYNVEKGNEKPNESMKNILSISFFQKLP